MSDTTELDELKQRLATAEAALARHAAVEKALCASEEKYKAIFEAIDEGFCLVEVLFDEHGKPADILHLDANPAYERHTGLKNIVGKRALEIAPEAGPWLDFYGEVALTGRSARIQPYFLIGRWITAYASRVGGEDSRKVAIVFNDVTERTLAEQALRESETRHRLLVESWTQAVWETDAAGVVTLDSPSWRAYTGQTPGEWLGHGWLDAIHPDERAYAERQWREAVAARRGVNAELRLRAPAGGWRWTNVLAAPVVDAKGEVEKWAGMNIDIDARKRAEEAVRDIESHQRALIEGVPQLIWRADENGAWTWSSPQWTAFTGLSEADSVGVGWLAALHPDDRADAEASWRSALSDGALTMETRVFNAAENQYRWVATRATPLRDRGGRVVEWLGTSTDIHDLRALQERQKVLVAELQHRTRNLMGVVRSIMEDTLRSSTDLDDFASRYRDRVEALSRVQGLLSRLSNGDRITFDALIRDEMAAVGASERATLHGPPGVALRSSTVQTFALALHELATNALKYGALAQSSGRLAITWRLETVQPGNKPWLHVDWQESGVAMSPPGATPQGTGQGRQLIERALPYQLGAKTSYIMGPDGIRCSIALPVSDRTAAGNLPPSGAKL